MSSSKLFETPSFKPSDPEYREDSNDFGDDACGEPAVEQNLVLDFTPDATIDNEIVQKKICDFWKFINSRPEIKNLKVKPEKCDIARPSSSSEVHLEVPEVVEDKVKTACSMLEEVGEKELITRAFEVKMPQFQTSFGSLEYKVNEDIHLKKKSRGPIICRCTKSCRPCPAKKPSKLKILHQTLQEWDAKHPQSIEPPGHPPALQHCIIQRQVFNS